MVYSVGPSVVVDVNEELLDYHWAALLVLRPGFRSGDSRLFHADVGGLVAQRVDCCLGVLSGRAEGARIFEDVEIVRVCQAKVARNILQVGESGEGLRVDWVAGQVERGCQIGTCLLRGGVDGQFRLLIRKRRAMGDLGLLYQLLDIHVLLLRAVQGSSCVLVPTGMHDAAVILFLEVVLAIQSLYLG